ncbi:hypothetical protein PsYK624_039990 [Phanerochaete sordida]|uniref:Uncharacterized protein n=1 Tax=Phanerochaete sordida TaxID=48140 RepID=A0A9P3G466_9APHY|nr:hypothetical protein PsYK624_039990 [Phanerochaete sordida]
MFGLAGARHALRAVCGRPSLTYTLRPIAHSFTLQQRANATLTSRSFPSLFESRAGPVRVLPFEGGDTVAGIMAHNISKNEFMFRHASQRTADLNLPAHDWQISIDKEILMYKIDPTQDLLVVAVRPDGQDRHTCFLQLLSMSTGRPHPLAAVSTLSVLAADPFPEQISISGSSVGVMTSMTKNEQNLNVWNWKSGLSLLDVPANQHLSFSLIDETHLLVGLLAPTFKGRYSALRVFTLEESGEGFQHRTLILPGLRDSVVNKINIVSQPTISAPDADRIISLQLDFYLNGDPSERRGLRIVTLLSVLEAYIEALDPQDACPWAAWAPHTRMFPPEYHEDDEPGGPYTYGTRFVRYDLLDAEVRAAETENLDLPSRLRLHAYPGAVEIIDFDVTPDECARAEEEGTAVLPWRQGAADEGPEDATPDLVEGDTYVVAPTTLPPDIAHACFVDEDAAVPTGLPYRRRVRALGPGFDRNYADGARVPALAAPLQFYRPEILRQVYRWRSGTPRFSDEFEAGIAEKCRAQEADETSEASETASDAPTGGRTRGRRTRKREPTVVWAAQGIQPQAVRKVRSAVVKAWRVKRREERAAAAAASGSGAVPPVAEDAAAPEDSDVGSEDAVTPEASDVDSEDDRVARAARAAKKLKVEDWVRPRLKAFEKVAMTEESLIFVRNCYSDNWWADESAGEEWLVLDLTNKGVL